jgi:hypothetical protein
MQVELKVGMRMGFGIRIGMGIEVWRKACSRGSGV